ncbi:MAG: Ig-like domain repeat protein [Gaiellales bacterium]
MYRSVQFLILLTMVAVIGFAPAVARAGGCPSEQSVMTSNDDLAVGGYICAQQDHSGEMSIGADKTHSWNQNTNAKMYPHWYCHPTTSSDVTVTLLTTWGTASFTATNWLTPTNTRDWAVGVLWTAGDAGVTGFEKGCSVNSQTFDNPPAILNISSISASGVPTSAVAGQTYTIAAKVKTSADSGTVAILDNDIPVSSADLNDGKATLSWTPAVTGTSKLTVVYKGNGHNTPATTSTYKVPVDGGTSVAISDIGLKPGSATLATATVTVGPATTAGGVALIDTKKQAAVGQAAIVGGVATINFTYKVGASYTFIAKYAGSPPGQSYPFSWNSPAALSSITASGIPTSGAVAGQTYPIAVKVQTNADGGTVAIQDNGVAVARADLSNGKATIPWIPAVTGTSKLTVVYKGNAYNSAATSPVYTVPVSGGTGMAVSGIAVNNDGTASATVSVTPTTTAGAVSLVDTATQAAVGQGTLVDGTATIAFPYEVGTSYTFVARYAGPPFGQSYPYGWTAPASRTLTATQAAALPSGLAAINATIAGGIDPQARTISASTRGGKPFSMRCPQGERLINVDAMTSGPVDEVGIGSLTSTGVKIQPTPADRGHRVIAQIICRPAGAGQVTTGGTSYGTVGPNRIALKAAGVAFGGPGRDRLSSTAAGSSLWGGLGRDTLVVGGASSVGDGGPGADALLATGSGRHLLVGGLGRDTMVGSFGPDVINARDGHGGDLVDCRSAQTRVLADAGDTISGPCIQVDTVNGEGTVAP